MLTRENAVEVVADAKGLVDISKSTPVAYRRTRSRSLRRFLSRLIEVQNDGAELVVMSWSRNEGHSPDQLDALEQYVGPLTSWLATHSKVAPLLQLQAITRNDTESTYCVTFALKSPMELASLSQLQQLVLAFRVLAESMLDFARDANATVFTSCPEYRYRGLPCSIAPDENLWYVGGQDKRGGGGILEWCYDEDDANAMLREMQKHATRFVGLTAAPYLAA